MQRPVGGMDRIRHFHRLRLHIICNLWSHPKGRRPSRSRGLERLWLHAFRGAYSATRTSSKERHIRTNYEKLSEARMQSSATWRNTLMSDNLPHFGPALRHSACHRRRPRARCAWVSWSIRSDRCGHRTAKRHQVSIATHLDNNCSPERKSWHMLTCDEVTPCLGWPRMADHFLDLGSNGSDHTRIPGGPNRKGGVVRIR